jgi:hypothetical protein
MKKFSLHIIIFFTILFFISCAKEEEEVICTMEWRYISIDVKGGVLDNFYTIRKYTGDTIRYEKDNILGNNSYIILSDNYQNKIKNKEEIFIFKGYITDSLVVNEQYIIKADECHINYVSGKKEINL